MNRYARSYSSSIFELMVSGRDIYIYKYNLTSYSMYVLRKSGSFDGGRGQTVGIQFKWIDYYPGPCSCS